MKGNMCMIVVSWRLPLAGGRCSNLVLSNAYGAVGAICCLLFSRYMQLACLTSSRRRTTGIFIQLFGKLEDLIVQKEMVVL